MNEALKNFVESTLSCIDSANEATNGKAKAHNLFDQLIGVRITLGTMGIVLDFEINPYYYEDKKPSTYSLRFAQ